MLIKQHNYGDTVHMYVSTHAHCFGMKVRHEHNKGQESRNEEYE